MQQEEFQTLVKALCQQQTLPQVLEVLKNHEDEEIAETAKSLTGQFVVAEVKDSLRIYHMTIQPDEEGKEQEFVEHIMDEGEDIIKCVAWFFDTFFGVKLKETYQAAGKTYKQPKRA